MHRRVPLGNKLATVAAMRVPQSVCAERDVAAISPGVFWQTRTRSDWVERQDDRVSAGVYIYIYI